jgi:HK97 family phage major capsid protein
VDRAHHVLEIKSIDEDRRVIEGIATSPKTDRVGDIVEPLGAQYTLPLPMLWMHGKDPFVGQTPIGHVVAATPTATGIPVRLQMERSDEPGRLKDILDFTWQALKKRLVRGLSIGFNNLESEQIKGSFGSRFTKWEWLELSAVAIAANGDAAIQTIKSLDTASVAASGLPQSPRPTAGASASPRLIAARKAASPMNATEHITEYENSRAAKAAARQAIQDKVAGEGRTKTDDEREEFDTLSKEIDSIDAELKDWRTIESTNKAKAVPVNGKTPEAAAAARGGTVVEVKSSNLPKGANFVRYAMAVGAGKGSLHSALEIAKHRWEKTSPEVVQVLKAAVAAGTTTDSDWAAPLVVYQNMASEFIEMLRPATIIGKITGFHRVPFNVSMPRQNTGSTVNWVGQAVAKPVGELSFDSVSLGIAKAAGIVVLAEELVRSSSPSAEEAVRRDLTAAIATFLDAQFINPEVAAVTNVSPASVTFGSTVVDSTGTTLAAFMTDMRTALAIFTANSLGLGGITIVMTETQAVALSMILNSFGQPQFPNITSTGGTLFGFPVVTSENIPAEGGSPAGKRIVLLKAGEILLADDGGVVIDSSREASVQMNTTPDNPATASTVLISLWQNNLVGVKVERFINWLKRRTHASVVIEGALYTG